MSITDRQSSIVGDKDLSIKQGQSFQHFGVLEALYFTHLDFRKT